MATTAIDPVKHSFDILCRQLKAIGDPITGADYLQQMTSFSWSVRVGFQILDKQYYCAYEVGEDALRDIKIGDTKLIRHIYDYFLSMIRDKTNEVFNEEPDEEEKDDSIWPLDDPSLDPWRVQWNGLRVYGHAIAESRWVCDYHYN